MAAAFSQRNAAPGYLGPAAPWVAFATGIAVGLGLSALVILGRRLQQRSARPVLPWDQQAVAGTPAPVLYPPSKAAASASLAESSAARAARAWPDTELDEELEQTFPASDPLPYSHRVD